MKIEANSVEEYIENCPEDRKEFIIRLRETILKNLPKGFHEELNYGMIGYVVPRSIYPKGYHCDTKMPLPFMNIANQKNFIALYHGGIYSIKELNEWFVNEYPKHVKTKLDMGKSCIRFKKPELIPYNLIAELVQKISVEEWIEYYENSTERK